MGGSRARIGRPEIQEPGRAAALPRTAAIARKCERKKKRLQSSRGRCCACIKSGDQTRSLRLQRRSKA